VVALPFGLAVPTVPIGFDPKRLEAALWTTMEREWFDVDRRRLGRTLDRVPVEQFDDLVFVAWCAMTWEDATDIADEFVRRRSGAAPEMYVVPMEVTEGAEWPCGNTQLLPVFHRQREFVLNMAGIGRTPLGQIEDRVFQHAHHPDDWPLSADELYEMMGDHARSAVARSDAGDFLALLRRVGRLGVHYELVAAVVGKALYSMLDTNRRDQTVRV